MRITAALVLLLVLCTFAFAKDPITVYLAGDSTMAAKRPEKRPETGWGEFLQKHFDERRVRVDNHAQNGRSTRTFITEGRWQTIVDKLKPGDYVLIQFGHNDSSKEKADRYTPPEDYRANLVRFVGEVRAKRATPVLMTPVMRRRFDKDGTVLDSHGEYPDIVRRAAAEQRVALVDMHRRSWQTLVSFGVEDSKKLFLQLAAGEHTNYPQGVNDNTHFSPRGAELMASLAVEGLREQKLGLSKFLKKIAKTNAVAGATTRR
ncbi:MAG TPA: rhamnogalacturonan acetylesterase [Pyrinomonadaceae bacterium]